MLPSATNNIQKLKFIKITTGKATNLFSFFFSFFLFSLFFFRLLFFFNENWWKMHPNYVIFWCSLKKKWKRNGFQINRPNFSEVSLAGNTTISFFWPNNVPRFWKFVTKLASKATKGSANSVMHPKMWMRMCELGGGKGCLFVFEHVVYNCLTYIFQDINIMTTTFITRTSCTLPLRPKLTPRKRINGLKQKHMKCIVFASFLSSCSIFLEALLL